MKLSPAPILLLAALASSGCGRTGDRDSFSGVRSMNERTQYRLADEPSTLGDGCDGWSRVLMSTNGGDWVGSARCWKREGDDILLGSPLETSERYAAAEWTE